MTTIDEMVVLNAPLTSLRMVMAGDARDWARNEADAWIYGIVIGWPKKALAEVAARHGWAPGDCRRLTRLHTALCRRLKVPPW